MAPSVASRVQHVTGWTPHQICCKLIVAPAFPKSYPICWQEKGLLMYCFVPVNNHQPVLGKLRKGSKFSITLHLDSSSLDAGICICKYLTLERFHKLLSVGRKRILFLVKTY